MSLKRRHSGTRITIRRIRSKTAGDVGWRQVVEALVASAPSWLLSAETPSVAIDTLLVRGEPAQCCLAGPTRNQGRVDGASRLECRRDLFGDHAFDFTSGRPTASSDPREPQAEDHLSVERSPPSVPRKPVPSHHNLIHDRNLVKFHRGDGSRRTNYRGEDGSRFRVIMPHTRRTNTAPTIAPMKPAPSSGPYQPTAWPR